MASGTDWSMVLAAAVALAIGCLASLDLAVDLLDLSPASLPEVIARFGRRVVDDHSSHVWAWQIWGRRALDYACLAGALLLFLRMELPGPYADQGNRVIWAIYGVAQVAWFACLLRLPRQGRMEKPGP